MNVVIILIWIVIAITALSTLTIIVFGLRSLAQGKISPLTMGMVSAPVALLVALGFSMGDWALAGVFTIGITLALAMLSLLVMGVRGLFS